MKVTYYKHYIANDFNRHQYNVLPILKNFCKIEEEDFRRSFRTTSEDNLFLFYIGSSTFLFIITKNNELIKTISSDSMSHKDIYEKLSDDESLGFASYVYMGQNFYGIASTFFGPKNSYWTHFVNLLLEKLNLGRYIFNSEPFAVSTTKKSALKFSFKSQTHIRINKKNPLFAQLNSMFGGSSETDTFTIEIKPELRQDMPKTFDSVINSISLEGVEKFIVRGKEFIEDSMADYYIVGSNHICDSITTKDEDKICTTLEDKALKNRYLKALVDEYAKDNSYIKGNLPDLAGFCDLGAWRHYL
ncbi:MAG: hypothetical protein RBR06_06260 [Desulfuromonadaceae bacterium]|nr:hypothetical protein [Desulfuromonadaceae bacterium]